MSLNPFEQCIQILMDIKMAHQEDKLVATQTSENVFLSDEMPKSFRDLDEKAVTDLVAEVIVHILESIEIEKEEGGIGVTRIGLRDCFLKLLKEERPVHGPSERVVNGAVLELHGGDLPLRHDREICRHDVEYLLDPGIHLAVIGVDHFNLSLQLTPVPDRHHEIGILGCVEACGDEGCVLSIV